MTLEETVKLGEAADRWREPVFERWLKRSRRHQMRHIHLVRCAILRGRLYKQCEPVSHRPPDTTDLAFIFDQKHGLRHEEWVTAAIAWLGGAPIKDAIEQVRKSRKTKGATP